ncbi:MAG: ATP-binding cassette domain-containing protein [Planctomycetota bacterium]|nr:ATP-binding cassette domain-containing protein [Planctomycetota bacterium]
MIEAEGLTKIFHDPKRGGEFRAVDDVSFVCQPGRIFGLLGPNGAGKTTTLRILSTSLVPTAGRARIDGCDVSSEPAAARQRLGFCTGTTGVYERLSPREMIEYFGNLYGMKPDALAARVEELLALFGLNPYADTVCGRLSAGNRQKVSLARTIVHDPPVLIFDEPTTSLDILVARTVTEFVADCRDRGRTVILSTHIMSEVEKLCDDVAMLHHGRILLQGSVGDVLAQAGVDSIEDVFFEHIDRCETAPSD